MIHICSNAAHENFTIKAWKFQIEAVSKSCDSDGIIQWDWPIHNQKLVFLTAMSRVKKSYDKASISKLKSHIWEHMKKPQMSILGWYSQLRFTNSR